MGKLVHLRPPTARPSGRVSTRPAAKPVDLDAARRDRERLREQAHQRVGLRMQQLLDEWAKLNALEADDKEPA